ncbi:MAG TPA: GreA/GreB family elongation factor [Candidatus Saccharimonadales bacterium]
MTEDLYILDSDKVFARRRIGELEAEIQALGPEFYEVFNQSSETWHDNAPFDALRDRQSVLAAELDKLRTVLRQSAVSIPKQKRGAVGIGSTVTTTNLTTNKQTIYFIAGDWTPYVGHVRNGATVISRQSPIGSILLGKKVGDTVAFKHPIRIDAIEYR